MMTKEKFWKKWMPCDWPPIEPSTKIKREFMADLDLLLEEAEIRGWFEGKEFGEDPYCHHFN